MAASSHDSEIATSVMSDDAPSVVGNYGPSGLPVVSLVALNTPCTCVCCKQSSEDIGLVAGVEMFASMMFSPCSGCCF